MIDGLLQLVSGQLFVSNRRNSCDGALLGIIGSSLSDQAASVAHRAATMGAISVKLIVDFSV